MAKKEFSWDSEKLIKTIEVSAYEKREIRICSLRSKQYVSFTTLKKIKEIWEPIAGYSIPKAMWNDVVDSIENSALEAAFSSAIQGDLTVNGAQALQKALNPKGNVIKKNPRVEATKKGAAKNA
jgi:hypothetical protein